MQSVVAVVVVLVVVVAAAVDVDVAGRVRKISPPQGFDSQTVQLIASRYSDYAI